MHYLIITVLSAMIAVGAYMANHVISGLKHTVAVMKVVHKKEIMKTKLRERSKRLITAIPVAGTVAAVWFEKSEYDEWKKENQTGTVEQYAAELQSEATELLREYCDDRESVCSRVSHALAAGG